MTALTVQNPAEISTSGKTFDQIINLWFDSDSMFRVREQSRKSYRKSLKAFTDWLTSRGIEQPTKQDVKNWCVDMDAQKLSTATKNLRLTTIRNFYKWLAAEYDAPNIVEGIKGWESKTTEHRRGFLSCEQMKKLIGVIDDSNVRGKRDKAIIATLLTAGLRTIEISRLTISDIRYQSGCVFLNVIGKGRDSGELVKISRRTEQLIQAWLAERERIDIVDGKSPLFCSLGRNSFGDKLSTNSISTLCKNYLNDAGLRVNEIQTAAGMKSDIIVAHSLRHSLATNALFKGASLREVQQQLRHANLTTTQRYLHDAEKASNRCTDIISEAIF